MIDRRSVLGLAAAAVAFSATAAFAEDWKAKYPELVFAVVPAENAAGVTERWTPFVEYLSKAIGAKVTLRVAQDYAGVIEGQKAGNIHIAYYGPASYSRATVVGAKIEPFAIDVNGDGTKGYYSVFYVKKDSPYQKIEDLKGKNLGLVDPNSTSGFNMPKYALSKMGIDPDTFFSKVVATGSHENAVIALSQGTVDVAANWWNSDDDSNLTRMVNKKMVPSKEDFRIIYKSPLIINSPYAYLADLPADLKKAISTAFYDAAKNAPEAFAKLSDGKNKPWEPIDDKSYDDTRALIKYVDDLRKKKS
ncbi:MAG: phosphonate ABC transporter substrate-binding protein [Hyphomicrobiales bacterium]|nr:phosphonate ABC transporter substrate-binding protein [Hyphomicrobiales bacterium]